MTNGVLALALTWAFAPSLAQATVREVPRQQAQGRERLERLELAPGRGVTLDFSATGEWLVKVWLDDPSRVVYDFDGCGEDCPYLGQALHLRQIERLNFPYLPSSETTVLRAIAVNPSTGTRTTYLFEVAPVDGGTTTTSVAIVPSPAPGSGLAAQRAPLDIAAVAAGMRVAESERWLEPDSALADRVEQAIAALSQGMSLAQAARQAGVTPALLERLEDLGRSH